jgi:uncharacterized CHY-type Zn-finger protein
LKNKQVLGINVDPQTRCKHYSSKLDIIAIKFKCCETYYPCIKCHGEMADHPPKVWAKHEFSTEAILCGACNYELTIEEYMKCLSSCPSCSAQFNPGCKNHYHYYFEI